MSRLLLYFVLILALALGGSWLADHAGTAVIQFENFEIHTSFAALALLLVLVTGFFGLIVWLTGLLRRELPLVGSNRAVKTQGRGLALLNQAIVALAADDPKGATRLVGRAELLLPPQPMLHLVGAEAAMRIGDHAAATKRFKALEGMEDGKLLGQRGLAQQARSQGRTAEAKRMATAALEHDGGNRWALDLLFSLQVQNGEFDGARQTLMKAAKRKLYDSDETRQHRGALYYSEALMLDLKGDRAGAMTAVKAAIKDRPELVPAHLLQVRLFSAAGLARKAASTLEKAFNRAPHPDLITAFLALEPNDSATARLNRLRKFTASHALQADTLFALADAEMKAGHTGAARDILAGLVDQSPTRAAWQLYANVLEALDMDANSARSSAAAATEDQRWFCRHCGSHSDRWTAICQTCDSFDTLAWGQQADISAPGRNTASEPQITLLGNL